MPGPIELPASPRRWPIAIAGAILAVIAIVLIALFAREPAERVPVDATPVIDTAPVPVVTTYVLLGPLAGPDLDGNPGLRADARSAIRRALQAADPDLRVVMDAREVAGVPRAVYLDATVERIRPGATDVPCSIHVLVATYPEKAIFGFADGKGQGRDASECIRRAIDQVVRAKIVPLIRAH